MESKAKDNAASAGPNTESQRRLEHISAEDSRHHSTREENYNNTESQNTSLQHVTDTRHEEPLSSVSSLEVHFDLLDLTELTDISDQEHYEVFEEDHNDLPSNQQLMQQTVFMPSPSWTRCSKRQHTREQKHRSDSKHAETSQD